MRIIPIQNSKQNNQFCGNRNIKQKEMKSITEHLRNHIFETAGMPKIPYEMRKTEYEMEQMLKSWGLKVNSTTKEIIIPENLNFIALENNNFRGALPIHFTDYKKLKESGITTVISATPRSGIKNAVENNGMNYIDLAAKHPIFTGGEDYIFMDFAFNEEERYMRKKVRAYESYGKYDKEYSSKEFTDKMLEKERTLFRTNSRKFIDELIKSVRAWQNGC